MGLVAFKEPAQAPKGKVLSFDEARVARQEQYDEVALELAVPEGYSFAAYTSRIKKEMATEIGKLFAGYYGDRYYPEVTQQSDWLVGQVEKGLWKAFVTKNKQGEVVAHAALLNSGYREYTFARLLVRPDCQKLGLAGLLTEARENYLKAVGGAHYVFSEAVTFGVQSQRTLDGFGFVPVGLRPEKFPKRFGEQDHGTMVALARVDSRERKGQRSVFLPEKYQKIVGQIVEQLGCERDFQSAAHGYFAPQQALSAAATMSLNDTPSISTCRDKLEQYGVLEMAVSGAVNIEQLIEIVERNKQTARFVSVAIPLGKAEALKQIEVLENLGFFFSMYTPEADQDVLTLQWNRQEIKAGLAELNPYAGLAYEIKRFVLSQIARQP